MRSKSAISPIETDGRQHALFVWACLLVFTEPVLFSYVDGLHAIYSVGKTVCSLAVVLYALTVYFKRLRLTLPLLSYLLFWFCFLIPSILNGSEIIGSARTLFNMIAIGLLFAIEFSLHPRLFLRRVQGLFFAYVVLSFALTLLFPQGFGIYIPGYNVIEDSRLNLLGLDNALIYPMLILMVSTYACRVLSVDYIFCRRIGPLAVSCTCLVYEILVWSGTGLIAVLLAVLLLALAARLPLVRRAFQCHFGIMLIVYFLVVVGLVLFNSYTSMIDVFQEYLNKGSSLLGRASLWSTAIDMIGSSPVYGYGLNAKVLASNLLMYSPHNLVLQTLLYGGVIALTFFVAQLGFFAHSVASFRKGTDQACCAAYAAVGLVAFLAVGLTEACLINMTFVFMLAMGWFIPKTSDDGGYLVPR